MTKLVRPMKVGLVSDTHGRFDDQLPLLFRDCELIVHAGDVVGHDVLRLLSALAPVAAVRGNCDIGADGEGLQDELVLRLEGLKALVLHDLGKPEKPRPEVRERIEAERPELVVFGHSHQPRVAKVGPRLFVNPGSAGPRRFDLPRAAGLLTVTGRSVRVELVDLDTRLEPLGDAVEIDL